MKEIFFSIFICFFQFGFREKAPKGWGLLQERTGFLDFAVDPEVLRFANHQTDYAESASDDEAGGEGIQHLIVGHDLLSGGGLYGSIVPERTQDVKCILKLFNQCLMAERLNPLFFFEILIIAFGAPCSSGKCLGILEKTDICIPSGRSSQQEEVSYFSSCRYGSENP